MSLINPKQRSNDYAVFTGTSTNHGSASSAYINFANTLLSSVGISKVTSNSIKIEETGLYFLKAPIYIYTSSTVSTVYVDIDINGSFTNLYTNSYSSGTHCFIMNRVFSFSSNSIIKIRTRFNTTGSNHTNGISLNDNLFNGNFFITKI